MRDAPPSPAAIGKADACPVCGEPCDDVTTCATCQTNLAALQALHGLPDQFFDQTLEHARLGQLTSARGAIAITLSLRPEDVEAWVVAGKLAAQQQDWTAARESFERALAVSPSCEAARRALSACPSALPTTRGRLSHRSVAALVAGAALVASVATAVVRPMERESVTVLEPKTPAEARETAVAVTTSAVSDPAAGPRTDAMRAGRKARAGLAALRAAGALAEETHVTVHEQGPSGLRLSGQATTPEQRGLVVRLARLLADEVELQDSVALVPGPVAEPGAGSYRIRSGDTLWSLARARFGDARRWRELARLNSHVNPHRLRVGTALRLQR